MGRMSFDPDMEGGSYEQRRDEIVLGAVHKGTMLKGGKTINAGMFPEYQKAIDFLVQQERLRARAEELQLLIGTYNNDSSTQDYGVIHVSRELLNKRLEHLSYLTKQLKEYES